jgi:hypothetical protein
VQSTLERFSQKNAHPMSLSPDLQENTVYQLSTFSIEFNATIAPPHIVFASRKELQPIQCLSAVSMLLGNCKRSPRSTRIRTLCIGCSIPPEMMSASIVTLDWSRWLGWQIRSTDVSPCSNSQAVLNYIAKYCTKEETKTATYADLVKEVLPHLNCAKPLLSLVSKTMNKLIVECDWSAQEVCHLLLNIPLQSGSCTVITLDCLPPGGSTVSFLAS